MRSATLLALSAALFFFFFTASALASYEHDPLTGSYSNEEFVFRWNVWRENHRFIEEHNRQNHTYHLAMNQFGDLTADEFKTRYTSEMSLAFDDYSAVLKEKAAFDVAAPASFDWRMVGGVTPVQNQGSCGCDYAFAAAGAIEGAHFVKFRQQVDVSEQNLVDCTYGGAYGNNGCGGGWASTCYKYVQANGVMAENEYRYEGRVGSCRHNTARPAASVSKYTMIPKGNENAIKDALFTNGPISVAFNSGTYAFAAYQSGILDVANCGNTPTLQVLIVGYGTENGKDFWIVKNSWGGGWGEKGYFRLVRGKNMCGIADWASYPTA